MEYGHPGTGRRHVITMVNMVEQAVPGMGRVRRCGEGVEGRQVVAYRHELVAHLADERIAYIPFLWPARRSAAYLLAYLQQHAQTRAFLGHMSNTPSELYEQMYRLAFRECTARRRVTPRGKCLWVVIREAERAELGVSVTADTGGAMTEFDVERLGGSEFTVGFH